MRDKTKVVLQKPHDLDTEAPRESRKQEQEGQGSRPSWVIQTA